MPSEVADFCAAAACARSTPSMLTPETAKSAANTTVSSHGNTRLFALSTILTLYPLLS